MDVDAWLTLVVLTATLATLVGGRVPPSLAVFGGTVALLALGVLGPADALAGFSNPAPFSVAALYVLARGVEKTGALQPLLRTALRSGGAAGRATLARLLPPVVASSALLNNTPIVATVSPQVAAWAERTGVPPSRFLMPLSFAAILGGMTTAIGTSTNLVVSGLMEGSGMAPMGMFEISHLGVPVALVGLAYLVLAAPRILRDRGTAAQSLGASVREFVVEMEVIDGGALDGATVETGGLRNLDGVFLAEVRRQDEVVAPAAPRTVLRGGDHLVFVGRADVVLDLRNNAGLRSAQHDLSSPFHAAGHTYFEAVVGPSSALVGRTLQQVEFRGRYQGAVVGIHRSGEPIRAQLGKVPLRVGDLLLVLSDEEFRARWRDREDFLLVSPLGGMAPATTKDGWLVALALVGVVLGAALGLVPILHGSLVAALALVAARVLTPGEARRAVDLDVVLLIASSFGLGTALEQTGLAAMAAAGILSVFGGLGSVGALLGVLLATVLLTEVVTNNAAVVLMFPVAMAAAGANDLDPRAVALAVAVAASASFLTPIGYQTNTMVYGPGGYRFGDYARLGLPLTLVVLAVLVGAVGWGA